MGYGDEGLARAKKWGKRTVKGEILAADAELTINFETSLVNYYAALRVNADNPKKARVEQLQELFSKLELYTGEINGNYEDIKPALLAYQKKSGIIRSDDDWGAGHF